MKITDKEIIAHFYSMSDERLTAVIVDIVDLDEKLAAKIVEFRKSRDKIKNLKKLEDIKGLGKVKWARLIVVLAADAYRAREENAARNSPEAQEALSVGLDGSSEGVKALQTV